MFARVESKIGFTVLHDLVLVYLPNPGVMLVNDFKRLDHQKSWE